MSADVLRRAAEAIRNDWRDEDGREFMFAAADWLDQTARLHDGGSTGPLDMTAAIAVANAYLSEEA